MILDENFDYKKVSDLIRVKCDYCGLEFDKRKAELVRGRKIITKDCCSNRICIVQKVQESNLQKYGTTCSLSTESAKQKSIETCRKRYGCDHSSSAAFFREKVKNTFLEKYGKHYTQTEEYLEKTKETCQKKYGHDHSSQSDIIKNKKKITNQQRYGCDFPSQNDEILKKIFSKNKQRQTYGKTEEEVRTFVEALSGQKFSPKFFDRKEIDMFNDDLKLGIEYCGLFFHNELSPNPRNKNYHYQKYKMCQKYNIKLITVFEDEWIYKNEQCKNILQSIFGIFKERIYGRKCKIEEINNKSVNSFYEKHHLFGKSYNTKKFFGLVINNDLVGAISIGSHHRYSNLITINRMCFKNGIQVIGGASKLFDKCLNWAKANHYNKITTWSDNRWSNGDIYKKLGFNLDKEMGPDYSYVNLKKKATRLSKQSQKKSNTHCPHEITERAWCISRNLARIWDCGKKRWVFTIK